MRGTGDGLQAHLYRRAIGLYELVTGFVSEKTEICASSTTDLALPGDAGVYEKAPSCIRVGSSSNRIDKMRDSLYPWPIPCCPAAQNEIVLPFLAQKMCPSGGVTNGSPPSSFACKRSLSHVVHAALAHSTGWTDHAHAGF